MSENLSPELKLRLQLRQQLKLTPLQIQSAQLLCMSAQELEAYIAEALTENPLLDSSPAGLDSEYARLRQQASWIDGNPRPQSYAGENPTDFGVEDSRLEGLLPFLRDQLERKHLPQDVYHTAVYLSHLLDENGYLDAEEWESLPVPAAIRKEALLQLRSLEPAGIGAFDLGECLSLQLERLGRADSLAAAIVSEFLPELGQKKYRLIARRLSCSEREVQEAAEEIARLEPRSGQIYAAESHSEYVRPDVFVAEIDGQWQVILNDSYLPRIFISDYYVRMLKESADPETKAYLRQKLQQARALLENLSRRGQTLRLCVEIILQRQADFFAGETCELQPLTAAELARQLNVHPSTVSRTLRGKYLQCRQGMYPLRYFCSGAAAEGTSRQAVKLRLLQLIKGEDPEHPLSDPRLCTLLEESGVQIARRTVSKYREELRIPPVSQRCKGSPSHLPYISV